MMKAIKWMAAPVVLGSLMLMTSSCSKDNEVVQAQEETATSEVEMKKPSPGTYIITKFTDTGDDETAQFNGYTFQFQKDGDLIATTANGEVFNGSWSLNSAETIMTIEISGNEALKDLDDDDWTVVRITNQKIRIKANGPDMVIFSKI